MTNEGVKNENGGDAPAQNGGGAKEGSGEPENFRKVFVGGLTSNTTDDMLREFYGQYGDLTDCIVMRDPQSKRSRGFGFVTFAAKSMVDAAMSARPHTIDGKQVDPKRAVPKDDKNRNESNVSTKRLYVSGVREDHTEAMLSEYFSKFGNVLKAEIILDKQTQKPRGFGFVSFDDYDPVDQCVLQRSHMINSYRCDVKKGLSKDEMNKQQQRDQNMRGSRTGRGGPDMRGGPGGGWGGPQQGGWGASAGGGQGRGGGGGSQWGQQGGGGGWGGPGGYQQGGYQGGYQQGGWGGDANAGGQYGGGGWGSGQGWQAQPPAPQGGGAQQWANAHRGY